jgi:hypothetical protein
MERGPKIFLQDQDWAIHYRCLLRSDRWRWRWWASSIFVARKSIRVLLLQVSHLGGHWRHTWSIILRSSSRIDSRSMRDKSLDTARSRLSTWVDLNARFCNGLRWSSLGIVSLCTNPLNCMQRNLSSPPNASMWSGREGDT